MNTLLLVGLRQIETINLAINLAFRVVLRHGVALVVYVLLQQELNRRASRLVHVVKNVASLPAVVWWSGT